MCGRYTAVSDVNEMKTYLQATNLSAGDIYPTNTAPILMDIDHTLKPYPMKWGISGFKKGSVIINARAETALDKPFFKNDIILSRCIVLSTGFYEWNNHKEKYLFKTLNSNMVYMAGFIKQTKSEKAFIILTTSANASMEKYHHRMPVILSADECSDWVYNLQFSKQVLMRTGPLLQAIKV